MTQSITVVFHSADYDGIFCREIARKFLPDATLIGWDFKDPKIPFPQGQVYVLDLSPDCFEQLTVETVNEGRLIWIDHHKTSIDKYERYNPQLPGYRIDGVAACRLAWQWFTADWKERIQQITPHKQEFVDRTVSEPYAVRLAGEYDIWDKRDPDAELFQHGLRSRELSEQDWQRMLDAEDASLTVEGLLMGGRAVQYSQQHQDESLVKYRSFVTEWQGLKFIVLNTARCNSLTFAALDIPQTGHDALMGFYFDGKAWNYSLYHAKHRTDLDLSEIAKKFDGGGHRGACGFRVPKGEQAPIIFT